MPFLCLSTALSTGAVKHRLFFAEHKAVMLQNMRCNLVKVFAFHMKQLAAHGASEMIMIAAICSADILVAGTVALVTDEAPHISFFDKLFKLTVDSGFAHRKTVFSKKHYDVVCGEMVGGFLQKC